MPGYIKRTNGVLRFRFVKTGFDPNGTVAPNNVIFDSNHLAYLQVYASGTFAIPSASSFAWRATFPALPYVPHAFANFRWSSSNICHTTALDSGATGKHTIQVKEDAIGADGSGFAETVYVDYVIFRKQAL